MISLSIRVVFRIDSPLDQTKGETSLNPCNISLSLVIILSSVYSFQFADLKSTVDHIDCLLNVIPSVIFSVIPARSLSGNALCQVSRLIDIAAPKDCNMVSKQLQGYYRYEGGKRLVG